MSPYFIVGALKALVAALGCAWLSLPSRLAERVAGKRARLVLPILGVLALAAWWNFGLLRSSGYLRFYEIYHYYVGSKYHAELGYDALYQCSVLAESQLGSATGLETRWIRDLRTNNLKPAVEVLRQGQRDCEARFTPARWEAFRQDIGWFRQRMNARGWQNALMDRGYNAPPAWNAVGGMLANLAPASQAQITALALLDPVILLLMWWLVGRTFGWPAAAVALLWWGTNYPARFHYTGGAFLRADWLAATVAGVCLARRDRYLGSGLALGFATSVRVFPALFAVAFLLVEVARMLRARQVAVSRGVRRFTAGFLVSLSVMVVAGSLANSGRWLDLADWRHFVENARIHVDTAATNHLGLRPLVSYRPSEQAAFLNQWWNDAPWDTWQEARRTAFRSVQPLYWTLLLAVAGLWAWAVARRPPWAAMAATAAVLPFFFELASFYFSIYLLVGLLWLERRVIGTLLAATAMLTWLPPFIWSQEEPAYVGLNVLLLAFSLVALALTGGAVTGRAVTRDPSPAAAPPPTTA